MCGRSKPQLNTQRKRQKSRDKKKTLPRVGKERRSSENIRQRTSSSAVCYCAIFGTAALPDARSSLLSNVGLVFSLLLSLNQGRPTFRPEDSFTIGKIFFPNQYKPCNVAIFYKTFDLFPRLAFFWVLPLTSVLSHNVRLSSYYENLPHKYFWLSCDLPDMDAGNLSNNITSLMLSSLHWL